MVPEGSHKSESLLRERTKAKDKLLTRYRASGRITMAILACWLNGLLYPTAETGRFIIC